MSVRKQRKKWRYEIMINGVRYGKSGYATKQEARSAEEAERKKIGKINTDFVGLCESRLEEVELKRTDQHFRETRVFLENITKLWGTKKEITREDVENYLNEVSKTSKPKANKHLKMLKALFNHGIKRDWFSYNPAGKIEKYPEDKNRKYIPPKEDILKVLAIAEESRSYLLAIIHTMGRVREINRLKWTDIHEGYLVLTTRKARNSSVKQRHIPINAVLKEVLEQIPKTGEYVFINPTTKTKYDYRSKLLKRLCERAEVKEFTFHCLRHFGASMLADQGEPLTAIQALLGHDRATTTDIYLQDLGLSVKGATEKLEVLK